jgi:hypothetical protein
MHRNISRSVSGFVFAVLAVGAGGCWGPSQFDVTGQVKYNGAPLDKPDGQIVFAGPNGTQVAASIGPDGTYRATKVAAGLNRIAVYYPHPDLRSGKRFPKKGEPPAPSTPTFLTPARYASVSTSDLSVQVRKDRVFNIDLTGPPIP